MVTHQKTAWNWKSRVAFFPKNGTLLRSVLVHTSQQFKHLKCSWCFSFFVIWTHQSPSFFSVNLPFPPHPLARWPHPRIITRVGGHRRQPVFKSGGAQGIWCRALLDRMACGVALALAIGGGAMCRRPAPGGKKRLSFEECSMCIKHRKYRQKWFWGGARLGQGAEPKNS